MPAELPNALYCLSTPAPQGVIPFPDPVAETAAQLDTLLAGAVRAGVLGGDAALKLAETFACQTGARLHWPALRGARRAMCVAEHHRRLAA